MLTPHSLTGSWTWLVDPAGPTETPAEARALLGRAIPARVPGALHPDLEAAGVIPDPLHDTNELDVAWVGRTDWTLARRFGAHRSAERTDLVFDGIDTVAEILLNGHALGQVRNMHRSYRYDISDLLDREGNELTLRFTSAYTEAEHWQRALGARPNAYPEPFNYIRKMACSFGWDWGPTIVGAGLWRDVRLESWSTARIASVRPLVDVDDTTGILTAHVDVARADSGRDRTLAVDVTVAQVTVRALLAPGEDQAQVVVRVPDVARWSPRGYGHATLYDVDVRLSVDEEPLDRRTNRVGFRTVHVNREPDRDGTPFVLEVNASPLFVKGVNWIPDNIHAGLLTRADYERRLTQAADAGVNLIRVWGGGIYESHDFYDVCDELGLLVWQDFLFACASYPEDEPLWAEIDAEARENVARLSPHPSLVLWCGTNENLWMHGDKDWPSQPGGLLDWGERYYLELLPRIVAEVDPTRAFTEGSPWSGSWEHDPNHVDHQTFHSWDVWNEQDYSHYRDSAPRFVSEFGWQGAAAWRTLRDAVDDDPLTIESPGIRHHQKAIDGHAKMSRALARHFDPTESFDAWHYQTQWAQVDAIRTGILHWRSHWPRTAGTILWQLNDLWPVISWSVVDAAGRLKPSYFALREVYQDRALTIEPDGDRLQLCVINDTDEPWRGLASLRRLRLDGDELASASVYVAAAPRSVRRIVIPRDVSAFDDAGAQLLVADIDAARVLWHPAAARHPAVIERPPTIAVLEAVGGLDIVVTADTVVRDLLVQPDRIHPRATVDRGFTTLLPGEVATFQVRANAPLDARAELDPFAIRSLSSIVGQSALDAVRLTQTTRHI